MGAKRALVRAPGASFHACISSHPLRHTISLDRARAQHARYCRTLSDLGFEVIKLKEDDKHPDACFIEDTAVIVGQKAFISRMAKESRRGEEKQVKDILKQYLNIAQAIAPATIEGGDVIHLPTRLISGITQRTNSAGVSQLREWLDIPVTTIEDSLIIHLKSHITYLAQNTLVTTKAYAAHPALSEFNVLVVPDDECYAANTLTIDDIVLLAAGFPKTKALIQQAGFSTIDMDMSEFMKCEGALTCLSLLF